MADISEKLKNIRKVTSKLNRNAAKEGKTISVGFLSDSEILNSIKGDPIPTACEQLNEQIGGGFQRGNLTSICGDPDSGKTSLLLETISRAMKEDENFMALWLESENSISLDIIEMFGIDKNRFQIIYPSASEGGEEALDNLIMYIESGAFDIAVINSIRMLSPRQEKEKGLGETTIALQARMNARFVRKMPDVLRESNTALIGVNHLSIDIGQMYGDGKKMTGGSSLQFTSIVTLDMRKRSISAADHITSEEGLKIAVKIKKNHVVNNKPLCTIIYYVILGKGIDSIYEVFSAGLNRGFIISSGGSYLSYVDENGEEKVRLNGKKNFMSYMAENTDVFCEIHNRAFPNHMISVKSEKDADVKNKKNKSKLKKAKEKDQIKKEVKEIKDAKEIKEVKEVKPKVNKKIAEFKKEAEAAEKAAEAEKESIKNEELQKL